MGICSHQGGLHAPCIASVSAFRLGAWEMLATGTQTPRHFLFDPGFTCALVSLKYTSKGICSHQGDLLVQEMASASDIAPALGLEKLGGVECRFADDAHSDALSAY